MRRLIFSKKHLTLLFILFFLPLLFVNCSDLTLKPDRKPESLEIDPIRIVSVVGDSLILDLSFTDKHEKPLTQTPAWLDTTYTIPDNSILKAKGNKLVAVGVGKTTFKIKISDFSARAIASVMPRMYVTQSIQTLGKSVPLVAGRAAALRLFLQGKQQTMSSDKIAINLYKNDTRFKTITVAPDEILVDQVSDHVSVISMRIPGQYIQPGVAMTVEGANGTIFPEDGTPVSLQVQSVPEFHIRLIPIHVAQTNQTGNLNSNNMDKYLEKLLDLYPINKYKADLHAPFSTNASPKSSQFYTTVLNEIAALRAAEGSPDYYYYGVFPQEGGGVVGIGFLGGRAAIGWDRNYRLASETLAHELGHSFNRPHAPCGGVAGTDPNYPYPGANIGVSGLEIDKLEVKPPTKYKDIMSYCHPTWISDYTYMRVLHYRNKVDSNQEKKQESTQDVLLVWGTIQNNNIRFKPAFSITAPPKLPSKSGPYRLSGYSKSGSQLFSFSFAGKKIVDGPKGTARSFVFAIPADRAQIDQLGMLKLRGKGGVVAKQQAAASVQFQRRTPVALDIKANRRNADIVSIQWNSNRYQMTLVKNPHTGEVLGFTKEGISGIRTDASELKLFFSDGVHTTTKRVIVQ